MAEGSIRVDRTRKFLITHGVLCGLAFLATSVETLSGVQTSFADIVRSYAISVIGGAMTLAAVKLYRRPAWTRWVAPAILAVDSALHVATPGRAHQKHQLAFGRAAQQSLDQSGAEEAGRAGDGDSLARQGFSDHDQFSSTPLTNR